MHRAEHRCRVAGVLRCAAKLLSEGERHDIVSYLAAFPKAGDVIIGTGGVRKLRWGRGGRGKSGVRVIYYFHSERIPLYLLTVFGKGERSDLTQKERNELAGLVDTLIRATSEKRK
ncbi:MAG TPA: addiction module toxin RelE [Casimicrobiaceae bacterium]